MGPHDIPSSTGPDVTHQGEQLQAYLPPRIERLGSLAELTLGGGGDPDDGFGGAGDEGSV